MTHEFIKIIEHYELAGAAGIPCVLATVVSLQGSGYRRPGVRMLLLASGREFGAVSGGCVEKEVRFQAQGVFADGAPKMMTYDGRYRLGCEGILHILLEPFRPGAAAIGAFKAHLGQRSPFGCDSFYRMQDGPHPNMGSILRLGDRVFPFRPDFKPQTGTLEFKQELPARMRLVIFGGEHDAVSLCSLAAGMGWEVLVVIVADEAKSAKDFPGVSEMKSVIPEAIEPDFVDARSAVLIMTHSYTKDLKYLLRLSDSNPGYLGILGPAKRRERLLNDLIEHRPEVSPEFIDGICGPAGLDIGSETAQEIAVSILAEILSVFRKSRPIPLSRKQGAIHPPE